jgi:S1-C subfamily serine protease
MRLRVLREGEMRIIVAFTFALVCLSALSAQSPPSSDITTISQAATKASVAIVTSDASRKPLSQGSGFLVSSNGKVVTNAHVIQGSVSAVAKFPDGAFYEVEGYLGADAGIDIAVLKLRAPGKEFPFLRFADVDQVAIGQHVIAIGSPMSLENTVSDGIVSALRNAGDLDPKLSPNLRVFQTTAPISPGSSGRALLNMQGEVIGITSFGIVTGQNLNFVIPISYAKLLLEADQVKPLALLAASVPAGDAKQGLAGLVGTYVGIWQSKLSGSGALALTVNVENGIMRGSATITGSPSGYKGDSLTASNLKDMGDGVWSVEFTGEHSKLAATGIFKPGTFVGDFTYKYSSHRRPDRGQWVVKR